MPREPDAILHDMGGDQHRWACAYHAVNSFTHGDGVGLYGKKQAMTYEYGNKVRDWSITVWRDSQGVHAIPAAIED